MRRTTPYLWHLPLELNQTDLRSIIPVFSTCGYRCSSELEWILETFNRQWERSRVDLEELAQGDDSVFQIASGSALEAESHLLIAYDLGYLSGQVHEDFMGQVKTIQRMLAALMQKLPN